jgi:hypothetical protein
VVHQHSTGASGITRVENPRAESTRKSTKVERAKYPVRLESASDVPPARQDAADAFQAAEYEGCCGRLHRHGGIFIGNGGEGHSVSQTFTVTNAAGESRDVTFTGRRVNSLRKEKIGYSPT